MRRIVVGFFALIGLAVVALAALAIGLWFWLAPGAKPVAENTVLMLDLSQKLPEGTSPAGIERVLLGEQTSLADVRDGLTRAAVDPRVKGVIARLGGGALGTAEAEELRDAIAAFRAKGKFALAYADSFGEAGP